MGFHFGQGFGEVVEAQMCELEHPRNEKWKIPVRSPSLALQPIQDYSLECIFPVLCSVVLNISSDGTSSPYPGENMA